MTKSITELSSYSSFTLIRIQKNCYIIRSLFEDKRLGTQRVVFYHLDEKFQSVFFNNISQLINNAEYMYFLAQGQAKEQRIGIFSLHIPCKEKHPSPILSLHVLVPLTTQCVTKLMSYVLPQLLTPSSFKPPCIQKSNSLLIESDKNEKQLDLLSPFSALESKDYVACAKALHRENVFLKGPIKDGQEGYFYEVLSNPLEIKHLIKALKTHNEEIFFYLKSHLDLSLPFFIALTSTEPIPLSIEDDLPNIPVIYYPYILVAASTSTLSQFPLRFFSTSLYFLGLAEQCEWNLPYIQELYNKKMEVRLGKGIPGKEDILEAITKSVTSFQISLKEIRDHQGNTLMHQALLEKNEVIFDLLFEIDTSLVFCRNAMGLTPLELPNINFCKIRDKNGNNLLHRAVAKQNDKILEVLIQKLPQLLEQENKDSLTPFQSALVRGDISTACRIGYLFRFFHNQPFVIKTTDLTAAIGGNVYETLNNLTKSYRKDHQTTTIMIDLKIACSRDNIEAILWLHDAGEVVDNDPTCLLSSYLTPSYHNMTPLEIAVHQESPNAFLLLLELGIPLNTNILGYTPLRYAVLHGKLPLARAILRHETATCTGAFIPTAEHLVCMDIAIFGRDENMAELLVSFGIPFPTSCKIKKDLSFASHPFYHFVAEGKIRFLHHLLQSQDPSLSLSPALALAMDLGQEDVVSLLLEAHVKLPLEDMMYAVARFRKLNLVSYFNVLLELIRWDKPQLLQLFLKKGYPQVLQDAHLLMEEAILRSQESCIRVLTSFGIPWPSLSRIEEIILIGENHHSSDPFLICITLKKYALVEHLLQQKALLFEDPRYQNVLDLVLTDNKMVNILISNGFPVNCEPSPSPEWQRTPLQKSIIHSAFSTFCTLVHRGARLEDVDTATWNLWDHVEATQVLSKELSHQEILKICHLFNFSPDEMEICENLPPFVLGISQKVPEYQKACEYHFDQIFLAWHFCQCIFSAWEALYPPNELEKKLYCLKPEDFMNLSLGVGKKKMPISSYKYLLQLSRFFEQHFEEYQQLAASSSSSIECNQLLIKVTAFIAHLKLRSDFITLSRFYGRHGTRQLKSLEERGMKLYNHVVKLKETFPKMLQEDLTHKMNVFEYLTTLGIVSESDSQKTIGCGFEDIYRYGLHDEKDLSVLGLPLRLHERFQKIEDKETFDIAVGQVRQSIDKTLSNRPEIAKELKQALEILDDVEFKQLQPLHKVNHLWSIALLKSYCERMDPSQLEGNSLFEYIEKHGREKYQLYIGYYDRF